MRPSSWIRRAAAVALAALASCSLSVPAGAVALTPEPPLLLFGDESAAGVWGARGFLFNPAAVGTRYPSELIVSWTRLEPNGEINHELLSLGGFGVMARRVKDRNQAYGFSLAGGQDPMRLGMTTTWLVSPSTHETKVDHRIGLLARPEPWLSWGVVLDHAFQPDFERVRLGRTWTLAAAVRPLALSRSRAHTLGTRFTLTGDALIPEDGEWGQTRVRIGGELELAPGLALRGSVEDHGGLHLGVGVWGPRAGVHAQTASVDGDRRYDTWSLSLHSGEERSQLASRAERRVAVVRAGGRLGDDRLSGFSLFGPVGDRPAKGLHEQLQRALEDPLTRGVLLELDGVSNMAQLEELRPRIRRLREAGKPVVAYLENGGGRGDLYLASACDRIVTTQEGEFAALGLRAERRYYRRLLADLGVRLDRSSVGKYKSAYRNYSVDSTTDADREVIEHNLDVAQELFVSAVSADRGMDRARLLTYLDGRYWYADQLRAGGLVDSVGYREDALGLLGRMCGLGDRPRTVKLTRAPAARREWTVPTRLAVVYASGSIATGEGGNDLLLGPYMGAATVSRQIEQAFKRPGVRGVVLRVESPGGTGLASDLIAHALRRMKRETRKPLIVSMGDVAASGGYQISAPGDRIFADRFTRTGSIGVLYVKPSFEGFYAKHGVRQDAFDRGAFMRGWSPGHDWNAEDQASADSSIFESYRRFVSLVAEGRHMTWDQVNEVAQGRVWMGEDARARGLVDEIGGLEAALREARRRAGIPQDEEIRVAEYRRPRPPLLQRLVGEAVTTAWERGARMPEPGEVLQWADDEQTR